MRRQARVGLVTHMDAEVLQSEGRKKSLLFFSALQWFTFATVEHESPLGRMALHMWVRVPI